MGDLRSNQVQDEEKILVGIELSREQPHPDSNHTSLLEKARPREHLSFKLEKCHAAIVICGGLCPGLNEAIRT
jgi:6-phosphofructokinase 1